MIISGADTTRFVHTPRGIHALETPAGAWTYAVQDGLGSVRIEAGAANTVSAAQTYAPFGSPFSTHGTFEGGFGFTGEQVDSSGQVYLRARYYNPSLGVFPSLDPFEGTVQRPMSLNGYAWVEGNVVNRIDPMGLQTEQEDREACETGGFSSFACKRFRARQTIDLLSGLTQIGSFFGLSFWWMQSGQLELDTREAAAWILQNEVFSVIAIPEAREWITEAIYRTLANQCGSGGCSRDELATWYAAYTVIIADYSDRSNPSFGNISPRWLGALLTRPSEEAFRYIEEFEEQSGCSWEPNQLNTGVGFRSEGGCYNHILSRIRRYDLYVSWWDEDEVAENVRTNYINYNEGDSGRMENTCFAARWVRAGDNKHFFIGSEPQRTGAQAGNITSCDALQPPTLAPTPTPTAKSIFPIKC